MSRFGLVRHGRVIVLGNGIILGFDIQGTNYYSPNLVDTDLSHTANDADTGTTGYPSGAEIPNSYLNARGQVTTLPGSDTAWVATFNSPEHAGQVNVVWSPAGAVSAVAVGSNCTINSLNLAAGTAVVTPTYLMSNLQAWALRFTPTGTAMTSLTAIPVGQSAGLTANFLAEAAQMSQVGGTLRNMKRNSVEDNQGFFVYQQSSSRTTFPSSGIFTAANRNTPGSPNTSASSGQISGQPDQWNGRKSDGEPFETMISHANSANRCLFFSTPWNCDATYLQAFADLVCSTATNTVYVETANEVWNTGYRVNGQARAEAHNRLCFLDRAGNVLIDDTTDPLSAANTDPTTSVTYHEGYLGAAERYCEKVIQQAQILKARCATNGKPNAIKIVFAWQNASSTYIAQMLDYIPRGSGGTATIDGTTVKANIDCVSSAPYFYQVNTSAVVAPPDMTALANDLKDSIDQVTTVAGQIAAAGTARGLSYLTYEGGDSVYATSFAVTCAATANTALSGGTAFPTFDGVTTGSGSLVLLKSQTTAAQNGVYTVGGTSTAWTLTRYNGGDVNSNFASWNIFPGANIYVNSGTTLGATQWICTSAPGGTLETTAITFAASAVVNSAEAYYASGDTTTPAASQIARHSIMYDCYMYWLDRLNQRLPSGSIITKYSNVAGNSGKFGSWGSIEMSTDMEMDAATLKANRPKAAAIRDFILGQRKLQALQGSCFAGTGASVGDVVGSYKRRTFGTTVGITGTTALGFVDASAEVLQMKVIDASAFVSAGTISANIVETDARDPAGSRTTAFTCPIIAGTIWSVSKSNSNYAITNSGLTGNLTSGTGLDLLLIASKASTSLDKWFDVTVDNRTGNFSIGLCVPGSANSGVQPLVVYWSGGQFIVNTNPTVTGLSTFTTGDKIRIRVKNNNVFYAAKWNGSAWIYQNGANPATDTGGLTVTGLDNTYLPAIDMVGTGSQGTADFTGW